MSKNLSLIEKILENSEIYSKTKAALLLKVCMLSRTFLPESFDDYWAKLKPMKDLLPLDYKKDYDSLQKALEPHTQSKSKGFVAELTAKISEAANDKENAAIILNECEKNLRKKWWIGGKSVAWIALINAWLPLERKNSIRLLQKVNGETQKDFLLRWNEEKSLSEDEWNDVLKSLSVTYTIEKIIEEILTKSESKVQVSEKIAKKIAFYLRNSMVSPAGTEDEKKETQAFKNYMSLVVDTEKHNSEVSIALMKDLYNFAVKNNQVFESDYLKGFTLVAKVLNNWVVLKSHHESALTYIEEVTPAYLKDLALSQWFGNLPNTPEEAVEAYTLMKEKVGSLFEAESNFYVLLIAGKLFDTAFELAKKSANHDKLIPHLTRAIIFEFPDEASKYIESPNQDTNPLEYFFMLSNTDERIEYLKKITSNGNQSLPDVFWRKPTLDDGITKKNKDSLYNYYMKTTAKNEQFGVFLRMHRHQYYTCDNFDNFLLVTLVKWHDQQPEEVDSLLEKMWNKIKPDDSDIKLDLFRNSIFERCRNVLCASPEKLFDYIKWINNKLVKSSYQWTVGQMSYTLSLKRETLFLYCILSAQKIANYSAKKCDEIILYGMNNFVDQFGFSENLVKVAAEIYASDKGLSALDYKMNLKDEIYKVWEIGIVEANITRMAQEMLEKKSVTATV